MSVPHFDNGHGRVTINKTGKCRAAYQVVVSYYPHGSADLYVVYEGPVASFAWKAFYREKRDLIRHADIIADHNAKVAAQTK